MNKQPAPHNYTIGVHVGITNLTFQPQPDITAWELSQCFQILFMGLFVPRGAGTHWEHLQDPAVARHFVEEVQTDE